MFCSDLISCCFAILGSQSYWSEEYRGIVAYKPTFQLPPKSKPNWGFGGHFSNRGGVVPPCWIWAWHRYRRRHIGHFSYLNDYQQLPAVTKSKSNITGPCHMAELENNIRNSLIYHLCLYQLFLQMWKTKEILCS